MKLQLIHVIGIAHFFLFFSFQLQDIWDDYFAPLDFQSHKFHHRDVGMIWFLIITLIVNFIVERRY